jgi:hypothetical protein
MTTTWTPVGGDIYPDGFLTETTSDGAYTVTTEDGAIASTDLWVLLEKP